MAKSRRKNSSLGVLFWLAVVLFILIIFLSNRRNIQGVIERTGLRQILQQQAEGSVDTPDANAATTDPEAANTAETTTNVPTNNARPVDVAEAERIINERSPGVAPETTSSGSTSPEVAVDTKEDTEEVALTPAHIYFISINNGVIEPVKVTRMVERGAPMTHALNWLIQGPNEAELSQGLLNLIPPNSQLISAYVKDTIAYLNFNEDFRYNHYGGEGTIAQLQQIVFSVTEFDTITQVQFLINGERVHHLHDESTIFIQDPINRTTFG